MARPKKAEAEKVRRREIYATDEEWERVAATAQAAGLTISRHLLSDRTGVIVDPALLFRTYQHLDQIQSALETVANGISESRGAHARGSLRQLVVIERRMAEWSRSGCLEDAVS